MNQRGAKTPWNRGASPDAQRSMRSGNLCLDGGCHFAGLRKTTCLFLGEEDLAVQGDVENTAMPLDQLRGESEFGFDLVRQTGGSRKIASGSAVFDNQSMIHPNSPFVRIIQGERVASTAVGPAASARGVEEGTFGVPGGAKGRRGITRRVGGNTEISSRLFNGCAPIVKARQVSERKFTSPLDFWFRVSIISFQRSEKGAKPEAFLCGGTGLLNRSCERAVPVTCCPIGGRIRRIAERLVGL